MKYDLWTRMYLRQYAFLMRHDARMSPNAACHLATLALSGLASLALVAFLSLGLWLLSLAGLVTLLPWSLPAWALVVCSIGIAFLPGMYIDRKMAPLRTVDAELIVHYSSSRQRLFWLMTLLSVFPLAAITAFASHTCARAHEHTLSLARRSESPTSGLPRIGSEGKAGRLSRLSGAAVSAAEALRARCNHVRALQLPSHGTFRVARGLGAALLSAFSGAVVYGLNNIAMTTLGLNAPCLAYLVSLSIVMWAALMVESRSLRRDLQSMMPPDD